MGFFESIYNFLNDKVMTQGLKTIASDYQQKVKELLESNENIKPFFDNYIQCIPYAKDIYSLINLPFFLKTQFFWHKIQRFLQGVADIGPSTLKQLDKKLDNNTDNILRLIQCIDSIETNKKAQYLINVTHALVNEEISRSDYFRVCYILVHTLDEDLDYLDANIKNKNLDYNNSVQGLLVSGLMYQSVIDGGTVDGDAYQQYSFTPVATMLYKFCLRYIPKS